MISRCERNRKALNVKKCKHLLSRLLTFCRRDVISFEEMHIGNVDCFNYLGIKKMTFKRSWMLIIAKVNCKLVTFTKLVNFMDMR